MAQQVKNPPAVQETQDMVFDPWVRKMPWRRKWQPTPVFLPGKSHGQRSLEVYVPWGHKRVGHDLVPRQQQHSNKLRLRSVELSSLITRGEDAIYSVDSARANSPVATAAASNSSPLTTAAGMLILLVFREPSVGQYSYSPS